MADGRPKVGVTVFVLSPHHPGCILMGIRKNSHGDGQYAPPGGHLEYGESFEACGRREVLEETGLTLTTVEYQTVVNEVLTDCNKHYVDIVLRATVDLTHRPEPLNMEPDKCEGWEWIPWDSLPPVERRFKPLQIIIESGYSPVL